MFFLHLGLDRINNIGSIGLTSEARRTRRQELAAVFVKFLSVIMDQCAAIIHYINFTICAESRFWLLSPYDKTRALQG